MQEINPHQCKGKTKKHNVDDSNYDMKSMGMKEIHHIDISKQTFSRVYWYVVYEFYMPVFEVVTKTIATETMLRTKENCGKNGCTKWI